MNYNPPCFFWIATYNDGTVLCQYDPETGAENKYSDVDPSRIDKIGWYPITPILAEKISQTVKVMPWLPIFEIKLNGRKPIILRRNSVKYGALSGEIQSRETTYLLGTEGDNILFISENGVIEVSNDFNYK